MLLASIAAHLMVTLLPCAQGSGEQKLQLAPAPQQITRLIDGRWDARLKAGYYKLVGTTAHCYVHWRAVALPGKTRHLTLRMLEGKDRANFTEEMWYSAAGTLPRQVARAELDPLDAPIDSHFFVQLEDNAWYADIIARGRYILRLMSGNGSVIASIGIPAARTTFGGYVVRNVPESEFASAAAGQPPFDEPSEVASDVMGRLWFLNRPASTVQLYDAGSGFRTFHLDVRAQPFDIAASEDGSVWFTEIFGNALGHFTAEKLSIYPVGDGPWGPRMPRSIVVGTHGAAFYTEANSRAFGIAYPDGSLREVTNVSDVFNVAGGSRSGLPTQAFGVASLSPAPQGGVWFGSGNWFGSFLTGVPLRRYRHATFVSDVRALSDGAWIFAGGVERVNLDGDLVRRFDDVKPKCPCWQRLSVVDSSGTPCELSDLAAACVRNGKTVVYDGTATALAIKTWTPKIGWPHGTDGHAVIGQGDAIWWTVPYQNLVMHLSDGKIDAIRIPTPNAGPTGIAATPQGSIWVVETWARKLAQIDPATMRVVKEVAIP